MAVRELKHVGVMLSANTVMFL